MKLIGLALAICAVTLTACTSDSKKEEFQGSGAGNHHPPRGTNDDDDAGIAAGGGHAGTGGRSDSGSPDEPVPGLGDIVSSALGSELSPGQLMTVCQEIDRRHGLVDDVTKACLVEAYLLTTDPSDCEQELQQCTLTGHTSLGLESHSSCAVSEVDAADCIATVQDMLDCAQQVGAFWTTRACTAGALSELEPSCTGDLASQCPSLFRNLAPGGGASPGRCMGTSNSCSLIFANMTCMAAGCTWSSSTETCSGVSRNCESNTEQLACNREPGCSWTLL